MSFHNGGKPIVTDGLVLALDASSDRSYPGSGTAWYDLSGNGYNGTLSAAAIGTVSSSLNTMAFNGTNNFVSGSTNLGISGNAEFTISYLAYWGDAVWVSANYPSGVGNNSTGISNTGLSTTWNAGKPALDFWVNRYRANTALNVQTWYHMSFTKTPGIISSTSKIYVNGVEVAGTVEETDTTPNITDSTFVVGRLDASRWFNGMINSVLVYNKALTAKEVLQNYNATKGRFD